MSHSSTLSWVVTYILNDILFNTGVNTNWYTFMHAPCVDWEIGCTRTLHWFVESGLFMDKKSPGFMPMNQGEVMWVSNQYRSADWDSHLDEFLVIEYRQIMDKVGEVSKMGEKTSQYAKYLRHLILLHRSHCKRLHLADYFKLPDSSSWLSLSE